MIEVTQKRKYYGKGNIAMFLLFTKDLLLGFPAWAYYKITGQ